MCGNDFSVAHGGENDINRDKDTSRHIRDMRMLHNDEENKPILVQA